MFVYTIPYLLAKKICCNFFMTFACFCRNNNCKWASFLCGKLSFPYQATLYRNEFNFSSLFVEHEKFQLKKKKRSEKAESETSNSFSSRSIVLFSRKKSCVVCSCDAHPQLSTEKLEHIQRNNEWKTVYVWKLWRKCSGYLTANETGIKT